MSSTVSISIPERLWEPIAGAPKDGTLIFIRDDEGDVDIAEWDRGEWNCELGTVVSPTQFSGFSLSHNADWRIGRTVQPKYAVDKDRHPGRAVVADVLEKFHETTDKIGVLVLRCERASHSDFGPYYIIDGADNWVTT